MKDGYQGGVAGRWSPDGSKIVVVFAPTDAPPGTCIYCIRIMNADGTGETQIAAGHNPDWQPIPQGLPRPKAATPLYLPLVPAYQACTAGAATDSMQNPPLAYGSCPRRAGLQPAHRGQLRRQRQGRQLHRLHQDGAPGQPHRPRPG